MEYDYDNFSSNNIYDIYLFYNNEYFVDKITLNNKNIPYILSNENFLIPIFKKDILSIYTIIDYFMNNKNDINIVKKNIQNLLDKQNLEFLEKCWLEIKNNNYIYKIPSNHIIINKDLYFYYLFNQIWLHNTHSDLITDIEVISQQMLILYYYDMFCMNDNKYTIQYDSEQYQEYIKLLYKYKKIYTKDNDNLLVFKQINKSLYVSDDKYNYIKLFFKFCIDNYIINKNIITWFFILLINDIPKYLYNDFYYIILNTSKHNLGIISKILSYLKINYYEHNEQNLKKLYKDISENNNYISDVLDNLNYNNDINYDNITNNILLIIKLKEKQNEPYLFLNDINLHELSNNNFFGLCIYSPLEISWNNFIFQTKNTYNEIINNLNLNYNFTEKYEELENIIKIYNSSICTDFKNSYKFLRISNVIKIENIEKTNFSFDIFDINYLFFHFLNYLYLYKIIPINNLTISENINKQTYNIDSIIKKYLLLYPYQEKDILNYINNL